MQIKNLIVYMAFAIIIFGFGSCKKNEAGAGNEELETTFELSGNDAITENMAEDASNILMETGIDNNFAGRNYGIATIETMNNLSCATVIINPAQGFSKTISIDFGAGCTSLNGIFRKGKITAVVSDSLRKAGSVSVMTFDNYYVGGYKIEGTITWTNTSQAAIKSWERKCVNGKITASDGRYWLHSGVKNIEQTSGAGTPYNLVDDIYSITGEHTITNAAGISATSTIVLPLQLKVSCGNVDKGTVNIAGPNHFALVDFGDGSCDRIATISIDGRAPRIVLLR